MRQKRRNLEWCVKSAWHIFYLTYPPAFLVYTYQFVRLFTFLYQDQQVVPRHRGKLRCTLAARRASPLQSVPNKSCEWNAGIPIKLTAKGTENQWVGKWICVRGPADPQRLCWLPSSLKHTHICICIYIYRYVQIYIYIIYIILQLWVIAHPLLPGQADCMDHLQLIHLSWRYPSHYLGEWSFTKSRRFKIMFCSIFNLLFGWGQNHSIISLHSLGTTTKFILKPSWSLFVSIFNQLPFQESNLPCPSIPSPPKEKN